MNKLEEACKWMDQTGRGYKAASKRWGVNAADLRELRHAIDNGVRPDLEGVPPTTEGEVDPTLLVKGGWRSALATLAQPNPPSTVRALSVPALEVARMLHPGGRMVGLTAGQFSLLDLARALLDVTGPADMTLSSWTIGRQDAETAGWLLGTGLIRSFRVLTDRSFPTLKPEYCKRLVAMFGEESFVATKNHAKFVVITNESWNVVIRSSMNMNKNRRFEQFDVDDDPVIAKFFLEFAEEIASHSTPGLSFIDGAEVEEGFEQVLAAERLTKQREVHAKEVAQRDALSKLPPLERARRILDDAQRTFEAAQVEGDHGMIARLIVPVGQAERRYSEVAAQHGAELVTLDEAQRWVREHVLPILTDDQVSRLLEVLGDGG